MHTAYNATNNPTNVFLAAYEKTKQIFLRHMKKNEIKSYLYDHLASSRQRLDDA